MFERGIYIGLALFGYLAFPQASHSDSASDTSVLSIMQEVNRRHDQFPYVYEEQSIILVDKNGRRDVRNSRQYMRLKEHGEGGILLVFDTPEEVKGVALRVLMDSSNRKTVDIYLPALEKRLVSTDERGRASQFLGTDFSVDDLQPDTLEDFIYKRLEDVIIDEQLHYVIEAIPVSKEVSAKNGYYRRQHIIQKEKLYIVKTIYFDRHDRLSKVQTRHEFRQYDATRWRPNMIMMENVRQQHKTLIKSKRRVFSPDYVPARMFSDDWLFEHKHMASTRQHLFINAAKNGFDEKAVAK